MMGLKEAKDIVDAILPATTETALSKIDTRERILLIKALREANAAGFNAGKAAAADRGDGTGPVAAGYKEGFDAGRAEAQREWRDEFQQRAIDYVVGCMKTADEVLKRVA